MLFNSANKNQKPDPRRAADYGWDFNLLEPKSDKKSASKMWDHVPPMIASFDLETTGFNNPDPISFGLAIYRNGKLSTNESQHFLIVPDRPIEEGAFETHGWNEEDLFWHRNGIAPSTEPKPFDAVERFMPLENIDIARKQYNQREQQKSKNPRMLFDDRYEIVDPVERNGRQFATVKNKIIAPAISQEDIDLPPAVPMSIGISKIVGRMANLQKQGFIFLGANPTYDTRCISQSFERANDGLPVQTMGFNPDSMRLIDVIQHDLAMEPQEVNPRSRSLSNLAKYYGIEGGGHRALGDSISAARVFIEGQVPRVQELLRVASKKTVRFSAVQASALGINYTAIGPCTGAGCSSCKHLSDIASTHDDPNNLSTINSIMQVHQGMQGENNA
jgi:DNA polymerase III epsilon subunit-like protein